MKLKDQPRNNNVDRTRSTMQRTVNQRTKLAQSFLAAATKRHTQVRRLNGFISTLINSGVISKEQVKQYFKQTKNDQMAGTTGV